MEPMFVLAMLALGRGLAWRAVVGPDAAHTLNQVVLYACLPAAIMRHAPKLSFEPALLGIVACLDRADEGTVEIDGKMVQVQIGANLAVIGSKEAK